MTQVRVFLAAFLTFCLVTITSQFALAEDKGFADGEMVLGDKNAPITVIEYASMTCPHCAHFHEQTYAAFKTKYIDTGQAKFIFREFPLDRLALAASILARCAGEQRFFPMLDVLFKQQSQWARAKDPSVALRSLGKLGGVSDAAFDACLASKPLSNLIINNRMNGEKEHKINSTPSFVINGELHSGALTIEQLDKAIADAS
jgi:protein-disulfide isomerase